MTSSITCSAASMSKADNSRVSARVVMEIERGIGNPSVRTLNQIGEIFGLEVGFVRRQRPEPEP
jgi:transcriptional regulator with XRE-family HTH domain